MDLTQPLQELVAKVPGAIGAVLMDNEGEAVTYCSREDTERARLIAAYHRIWLSDCLKLTQQLRLGNLQQMIQRYEHGTVLGIALKDNHALVLLGEKEMFVGQAQLQAQQIAATINEDL